MSKQPNANQEAVADDGTEIDDNVDKIRDILFGGQMRDYDKRFADLEKRLTAHVERLSSDLDARIERLNAYTKSELDKLTDNLKSERKDRIADVKQGSAGLQEFAERSEGLLAETEERLDAETKNLRHALHDQNEDLSALVRKTRNEMSDAMGQETQELANAKLGREDLAALLSEVALRLKDDFKLPKS